MGSKEGGRPAKRRAKFPWLLLLLLMATVYALWILPLQMGPRTVKVEFTGANER